MGAAAVRLRTSYRMKKLERTTRSVTLIVRNMTDGGREAVIEEELHSPVRKLISKIERQFSFEFDEQTHRLVYGNIPLSDYNAPLSYYVEDYSTIFILGRLPGGGSAFDFVSNCPDCPGKSTCKIFEYCVVNMSSSVNCVSEDAWIGLCEAFNVSSSIKRIIMDNAESASIRCADLIHRLCHIDPTLTWSTIKEHIQNAN